VAVEQDPTRQLEKGADLHLIDPTRLDAERASEVNAGSRLG
jgi:hypothetical protein